MLVSWLAVSPTTMDSETAAAICSASAKRSRGTNIRDGALHDCPVLLYMCKTPRVTAASRSASFKIMFGDFPPSSCVTRFTVGAAFCATKDPARVDPVNDIMSTSGCLDNAVPTPGPSPFTILKTPAGTPASCMISAKIYDDSGATSLGFSTIVQPTASAGATLHVT